MTPLSARIIEVRQSLSMSKAEFARALGVSKTTAGKWDTGETKEVKHTHLAEMTQLSGYSADWIATGKGPKFASDTRPITVNESRPFYQSASRPLTGKQLIKHLREHADDYSVDELLELSSTATDLVRKLASSKHRG